MNTMNPHRLFEFRRLAVIFLTFAASFNSFGASPWADGITEPITDVTMSTPVIGILGARPFDEGTPVKKGQVVAEIEKKLEELEVGRRKLVRDLAKVELERLKTLAERNAISLRREDLDKRESEFNIASVEYDLAEEQLRRRHIVAPFDGIITEYFRQVGEACEAQQPVVRIVDTSRCYFVCNVESRAGHGLKRGDVVKLEIESGASIAAFEGKVYFVSPVVDPASGLMKIKAIFENPEGRVRPGVAGRMLLPES